MFVISNADDAVADNRHPFLLVESSHASAFVNRFNMILATFVTLLSLHPRHLFNPVLKFPHSFPNHRQGSWGEITPPASISGECNRTSRFCPSHIGSRRVIPVPLKLADQLIYDRVSFHHAFFELIFLLFRYSLKILLLQFYCQRFDQSLLNRL